MIERVAAAEGLINHTSAWLLLAAVLVGFSAAWLVFELRRAWSPDALRPDDASSLTPHEVEAFRNLMQLMPKLLDHVSQLRREIAEARSSELAAHRTRERGSDYDQGVTHLESSSEPR
jgi:hypothetical protein